MPRTNILIHNTLLILGLACLGHSAVSAQATLPLTRSVWGGMPPTGWTDTGTGTYGTNCDASTQSNGSGQLNDSGDFYTVHFNNAPQTLSCGLTGQGLSGVYEFRIEESTDGLNFTSLEIFTSANSPTSGTPCGTETYTLASATRFVRFRYVTKATGNFRLDEVSITAGAPATPAITHTGTTPAAADVLQGSVNNILYQVQIATSSATTVLSAVTATTSGTWMPADINNFKLRYSTNNTLDGADPTLATLSGGFSGGIQDLDFDGFTQNILIGNVWIFITCDVASDANIGNMVQAGTDADADFTYAPAPTFSGSSFDVPNAITIVGAPEIQLEHPADNNIDCGATVGFGNVSVGSTTTTTIRIRNMGSADLDITNLPLSITGSGDFSITGQPVTPIAPGDFSDLTVQFAASLAGLKTASISISNNDASENPCVVYLSGTGTAPEIQLESPVGANIACGANVNMGSVPAGTTFSQTIRIRNTGAETLDLTTLPLILTGDVEFTITTQPTSPIAAGSFSDVVVQFAPVTAGSFTASFSIASNDADENPCMVNLQGTGTVPEIQLQNPGSTNINCGATVNFGSVNQGANKSETIRIRNTGTAPLNITTLPLTVTGAPEFTITTQPSSPVNGGSFSDVVVRFSPNSGGSFSASISIANNDADENPCIVILEGTGIPFLHFRSKQNGDWSSVSTWESSADNTNWSDAAAIPDALQDLSISIQSGHTVTLTASTTVDELTVANGGTLQWNGGTLTINDGSGVDLIVEGTFEDNGPSSVIFSGSAKWELGASGTMIRTQNNGSNDWQNGYNGGIAGIPSTSNWILRKTASGFPSVTSTGAFYGNLILENYSGSWNTATSSNFVGSSGGFPTIKGNFDVGGNGPLAVSFFTSNSNSNPVRILGDLQVRPNSTLRTSNSGTGFEVSGNVIVDGTLDLTTAGSSPGILRFSEGNAQTVSGSGTYNIRNMQVFKSANDVTLLRDLTTLNLTLSFGNVVLGPYDFTVTTSNTGGNADSYVETNGDGVMIQPAGNKVFPVGNSTYNPATVNNTGANDNFNLRVVDVVLTDGESGAPYTSNVVNRTWHINEAVAGGSNATITLQWNQSNELSGFNRNACFVSRHNGLNWNGSSSSAASGGGPYTRSRSGFTEFSPFAIASGTALPVELLTFTAHKNGEQARLHWQTASESNNAFFAVERATDGSVFGEIGRVDGSGNSTVVNTYLFDDESPQRGVNYYRLRQTDFDGSENYSPVAAVVFESTQAMLLYPSPTSGELNITFAEPLEETATWEIYDMSGRRLMEGKTEVDATGFTVKTHPLPEGMYVFIFQNGRQITKERFVVKR